MHSVDFMPSEFWRLRSPSHHEHEPVSSPAWRSGACSGAESNKSNQPPPTSTTCQAVPDTPYHPNTQEQTLAATCQGAPPAAQCLCIVNGQRSAKHIRLS
mmetsp:Transcript_5312/g.11620  ORF Transcript_5312/g.11620 Transcript_5312/m.11620 type:complete len:100 (+) Transcript_5312:2610-2909(+)